MNSSTLGLKSIFASISAKDLLRKLIVGLSPEANAVLALQPNDGQFLDYCKELRTRNSREYEKVVCALRDTSDIAADATLPDRLFSLLRKEHATFFETFERDQQTVQNAALWAYINAPSIWGRLTMQNVALHGGAHRWQEFLPMVYNRVPRKDTDALSKAISDYLVRETLHGERVHIELDESNDADRYFVSVNNIPSNVQQFDPQGCYAVSRNANAVNIVFEYQPKENLIRVRCPLGARRNRGLASVFSRVVLNVDAIPLLKHGINLSKRLMRPNMPEPTDEALRKVRHTGLKVAFVNDEGLRESCMLECGGFSNLWVRMHECLAGMRIAEERVSVTELKYDILATSSKGKSTTVHVSVRTDGFHFICRDEPLRLIITNYLRKAFL